MYRIFRLPTDGVSSRENSSNNQGQTVQEKEEFRRADEQLTLAF